MFIDIVLNTLNLVNNLVSCFKHSGIFKFILIKRKTHIKHYTWMFRRVSSNVKTYSMRVFIHKHSFHNKFHRNRMVLTSSLTFAVVVVCLENSFQWIALQQIFVYKFSIWNLEFGAQPSFKLKMSNTAHDVVLVNFSFCLCFIS